jgi:predicted transcriptional regulator
MKTKKMKKTNVTEVERLIKALGLTPELVMLYMAGYMNKNKAEEIGMNIKTPDGGKYYIKSIIREGYVEDEDPLPKNIKQCVPRVV